MRSSTQKRSPCSTSPQRGGPSNVYGPASMVSSQQAVSKASICWPPCARRRSVRMRSSLTLSPRTVPIRPEGQTMVREPKGLAADWGCVRVISNLHALAGRFELRLEVIDSQRQLGNQDFVRRVVPFAGDELDRERTVHVP